MKFIIISLLAISLVANASSNPPEPTLSVIGSAKGYVPAGVQKAKEIMVPGRGKIEPAPKADERQPYTEVIILSYKFPDLGSIPKPQEDLILKSEISENDLLAAIDALGYRPARVEEMFAVRDKFTLNSDVRVYGSAVKEKNGSLSSFRIRYEYGGDIGMFHRGESLRKRNVFVAVVKK